MSNNLIVRFTIVAFLVIVLTFVLSAKAQAPENGIADTPWPMYQHDPQHTGRSPFLGPTLQPLLLWTAQLPKCTGSNGGISIAKDGSLLLSLGGCLHRFDPITRERKWTFSGDTSLSVPLVAADNNIYWGFGMIFAQISPNGEMNWEVNLDPNWVFGSSPAFGPDNNLYFVHDGLWSFTPAGEYRWYIPYGGIASHAAPAIGSDGTIYAGGTYLDLCAYLPDSSMDWCLDIPDYTAWDKTSAVSSDGIIYHPTDEGAVVAINPSGSVEWTFQATEANFFGAHDGIAIAPDGSIYFGLNTGYSENYLYAIDAKGQFKWKVPFQSNLLTGLAPFMRYPITVDRAGNAFICPENSRCYGIDPDGSILWEFEFPLVDSIIVTGGTQPIIAADGLLYIVDYQHRLYAFADPALYPALTTSYSNISFQVEPGATSFTTTLPISSTVSPITFTASISPAAEWITITHPTSVTPSELTIRFDPATLPPGIYHTNLRVTPSYQAGVWLEIPVTLNVGMKQVFLPVVSYGYRQPYRILYGSSWFQEPQLASIDQTGQNRTAISRQLDTYLSLVYSPDGLKVVTIPFDGKYHLKIMDTTTGQIILNVTDQTINAYPTWSPDSNQLAFVSTQDAPGVEVYVINVDGTGLKRLTYNQIVEKNLFWSPTGDRIAVESSVEQTYLMNSDGSNFHQLIPGNWSDVPLGWSPDGYHLLLSSKVNNSSSPIQLGVYDLQTGVYTFLTDQFRGQAVWSPDGTRIAYVGWDGQNAFDWDIFVVNADGSGVINLSHVLDKEDSQPAWSPDSHWLAFISRRDDIYGDTNYDIYIVRPNGTGLMQVTTNTQTDLNPFWKP